MLRFRLSLSRRQSNPSILTAGLLPKFTRTHPPFRPAEGGGDDGGEAAGEKRGSSFGFSSPNLASWINGLATLLGGDPQKYGGDEANCVLRLKFSNPQPPLKKRRSRASESKECLNGLSLPVLFIRPRRRGFGQTTRSWRSAAAALIISSQSQFIFF